MSKIKFKQFVKNNPKLINYVKSGEMTWQKFYEMYDLYGDSNDAWKEYLPEEKEESTTSTLFTLGEVARWLKTVNLDSVQEGISNIQRVLGVFQDFSRPSSEEGTKKEYKPRPLYKHFED